MYQKHILFLLCLFPFPIFVNNRYSAGWAKVDVGPQVTFQQKRYVTDAGRQINFQQKRYVTDKGRQMNFQQKLCDWRGPKWHFSKNVTWLTRGAKLTFSKNITFLTRGAELPFSLSNSDNISDFEKSKTPENVFRRRPRSNIFMIFSILVEIPVNVSEGLGQNTKAWFCSLFCPNPAHILARICHIAYF